MKRGMKLSKRQRRALRDEARRAALVAWPRCCVFQVSTETMDRLLEAAKQRLYALSGLPRSEIMAMQQAPMLARRERR